MLPRKLAQATNLKSTHYCVTMIQCIKYGLNHLVQEIVCGNIILVKI